MTYRLTIINCDDTVEVIEQSIEPTLTQLQTAVGGYIELVPHFVPEAYCNEEGKLHQLPVNVTATALWWEAMGIAICDDFLVGSVVLVENLDA